MPGIGPTKSWVIHIHSGQNTMNNITDMASDDVLVATYESYSLAIMMPENAGGRAPATTSIAVLAGVILNIIATSNNNPGISISFRITPRIACQLTFTFTAESVIPAANTAIDALAPFIRSNEGLAHAGQGIPAITHITARIGALSLIHI